jgi:hypothetical protein
MNLGDKTKQANILPKRANLLTPILLLWGGLVLLIGVLGVVFGEFRFSASDLHIIPWAIGAGILLVIPTIVFIYRGTFDLFHPLVYALWSYIFPAFVLGGFILGFGWTRIYFLSYVNEPTISYPLALLYVVLGYYGVVAGYYLPIGKYVTGLAEKYGPSWEWQLKDVWFPGLLLVLAGVGLNILGLIQGLLGFQRVDQIGLFDGVLVYLSVCFTVGTILIWIGIFKAERKDGIYYGMLLLMIMAVPFRMALLGSRSSLLLSVIPIGLAFWYSNRKITWVHSTVFAVGAFLAIMIGIVYGTTFRNIKGSEARMSAGDYVGQVFETADYLSRKDSTAVLLDGFESLAERIENLSSLAVVVSNYEELEVYEESYGLKNNIRNDLMTSMVPRFIWPNKPTTSDPRAYSDLYFNYGENSFAITPFGDLLRNFGVIGIPLGMMLVGLFLRVVYGYLIDTPNPQLWKTAAYFPLLTVVSYESFYAIIFPSAIRVLVVLAISLIFANFFFRKTKKLNTFAF